MKPVRAISTNARSNAPRLFCESPNASGDALKAVRRAIEYCLKEASAGAIAGRALIEAIDAARSIARNRA